MRNFLKQVNFALQGIRYFISYERNARIQATIAVLAITAGFIFGISSTEWCHILLCMALVLCLEMVNTSIERICLLLSEEYHPVIKIIKDVAAGAVLVAAVVSAIIGVIIFLPHIVH